MKRSVLSLSLLLFSGCAHDVYREPATHARKHALESYPILNQLQSSGTVLSADAVKWMKKWNGIDLEQTDVYQFPGLSGSSSVNLKVQKVDPKKPKDTEGLGIFLAPNDSGNPTVELAYFNLSAILGWDKIVRPAAPYVLGPKASQEFLALIEAGPISALQQSNADNIVKLIKTGNPLQGCLKAERDKNAAAADAMCDPNYGDNGGPNLTSPVIASLQIAQPAPVAGEKMTVIPGFTGDALQLATEYSIVMTFDAIFQQGDRYSGGNLSIRNDANGQAHFYLSDNGGGYLQEDASSVTKNLSWFSRYDRQTVAKLRTINQFLLHPSLGFIGYTDALRFVTDLGFYFELSPADSLRIFQRNIQMFLDQVDQTVAKYGNSAYLN